jgi:hypothetical protein
MSDVPGWLVVPVVTSAVAFFFFVAQRIFEWLLAVREAKIAKKEKLEDLRSVRLARLKELQSLLRATRTVFVIQVEIRNKLYDMVERDFPDIAKTEKGFDAIFSKAFSKFDSEHMELHKIIRSYTIYALKPLNLSILKWLEDDTYFKSRLNDKNNLGKLAKRLADLEAHLLLWNAKYEMWIPESPENCLVYMADEKDHGLGFPNRDENKDGIEELVGKVLDELA